MTSYRLSSWCCVVSVTVVFIFFFNDPATTEIYTYRHTLSLHDALPISAKLCDQEGVLSRPPPGLHPGAVLAGHAQHVDDVLDADRNAVQRHDRTAGPAMAAQRCRLPQRVHRIEMRPGDRKSGVAGKGGAVSGGSGGVHSSKT